MHLIWQVNMYDPPVTLPLPRIVNLLADLKEERDAVLKAGLLTVPMTKILAEWESSLEKYPPIKMGTPDPTFRQKNKRTHRLRPMFAQIRNDNALLIT